MKLCLAIGLTLAALCGASTFAQARPPTVTVSPGYDARLQQSRSALSGTTTTANPTVAKSSHNKKKKHTN
ncbi:MULTISPECIES: hypothetical protein [unclassified Bradyrhizobium]|uniref:hypothetical protein n=1 Tax=unclassified Bradyrhizobium TaxID=2631580 RepID=UPI0024788BBD|nr:MULTISPECIES: hypothetical protein [unclassified Bradyrhizobium]WGR74681.1 hypothetical protein MTX24_18425 [Bradyrhizobium sp. ISRA426]WGR79516.1 hypothetical protein MTX21_03540 [Bradyrhizobium sp. ISRA430]WGR89853.1 hypothetical protein MTX25_18105 [Bradyrhizobium sp. ISRA432]